MLQCSTRTLSVLSFRPATKGLCRIEWSQSALPRWCALPPQHKRWPVQAHPPDQSWACRGLTDQEFSACFSTGLAGAMLHAIIIVINIVIHRHRHPYDYDSPAHAKIFDQVVCWTFEQPDDCLILAKLPRPGPGVSRRTASTLSTLMLITSAQAAVVM